MPLIERKPFKRIKPPKDLRPNEELFYIATTQEVFRNYNDFFERVILINSLIWSCSLTGKSGLTYQEAVDSEKEALENLKSFPHALKKPVLYLASLTERKRLNDLCDDVFNYVKDRYFIGEEVDVTVNGVKRSCEVTQVIIPEKVLKSPSKNENVKPKKAKDIPPSKIKYEVVDYGSGRTSVVKADCLSRPKGTYTKPRNKLFLKQQTQSKDGVWKIKDSVAAKQDMEEFNFSEVHCGPLPSYAKEKTPAPVTKKSASSEKQPKSAKKSEKAANDASGKKTVQGKLNFKKETTEDKKKNLDKEALEEKKRLAEEKERQKMRDSLKKQIEEEKEKQRMDKINERLKKKEEKRIMAEYMSSWKKPRDDLECDDLKDLPVPMPIDCGIPQSCFGDALMMLEFLSTFEKQVSVKDIFPQGVTFEHIEKALTETDIQGVFNDLLQLFLTAIFQYQEVDDDSFDLKDRTFEGIDNLDLDKAAEVGSVVMHWPQKYQGTALRNIPLDSFSITEVLRLHILSSGGKPRINWQGQSTRSEDPALFFKVEEAELLKKLESQSVFDLDCEERCKVISLLMNQLLNGDVLKYAVDENAEKTRPLRHQLKQLRWAYSRKEKEDTLSNKKKSKETKDGINGEEQGEEANSSAPIIVVDEEKENTDNLTPEEKAELEEKKAKELAKLKAEFQRKEKEIEQQIRKLQASFNVVPLGRDRAYRRYWVFQTVPGIFVEDDDPFKGDCLPKVTVQNPYPNASNAKTETSATNIKKYLQNLDSKSTSSDKENEILREIAIVQSEFPFPTKNRKLTDLNPRVDSKKGVAGETNLTEEEGCLQCKNKLDMQDNLNWFCPHSKGGLPSDQCTANIDTCPIHNLNAPRMTWGFYYREEDIENLIDSLNPRGFRERPLKDALISEKEHLKETLSKCSYNSFNKNLIPEVRKSQRLQYQKSSYADMSPRQALELTIRDMILELEHRISAGGLGSLKIENPESWRTSIEQGGLHLQIENAKSGETSVKEEIAEDIKKLSAPIPYEQVIKELALATLQLSQGIEAKYLNSPLGESDQKSKPKVPEDAESQKKKTSPVKKSPLERWQESLSQCSSLSQLYVHLGTLERSVAWSRSVLKAHCRICRRRGDGENMLLCDGCNRGHHLYCLKPPLKAIPEGDWFCLSCKPVEKPASPQKKLRKVESDSEEEQSEEEEEESDEEEYDEESSVADGTFVQESCEHCNGVGTLLCCDRCPLMYHQECVNLKRIPRGEWLCPKCNKKEEALKKAQKHPASGSYGTRSSSLTTDSKKTNPLKNKPVSKGTKRKYEDSFEEEFEPPSKRSHRERRSRTDDTDSNDNPFKKVYKDSAQNAARRRSKTGKGDDMLDYKACIDLLVELMRHPSSWPFLVPVSKKDAPDYHTIIKRPMDFGTIRSKLNYMEYRTNEDFVRDVYLVLQNCEWFNPKGSPEFKAAQVLYKEVKRLLEEYDINNPFGSGKQIPNVNEE